MYICIYVHICWCIHIISNIGVCRDASTGPNEPQSDTPCHFSIFRFCPSVRLSICLSLFLCLSIRLSVSPYVSRSFCRSISPSFCFAVSLSRCLAVSLSLCTSACLRVSQLLCVSQLSVFLTRAHSCMSCVCVCVCVCACVCVCMYGVCVEDLNLVPIVTGGLRTFCY